MSKKILVTGITGFIGRVLTNYLLEDSETELIDGCDNLSNSSLLSGDSILSDPRVHIEICSVQQFEANNRYDEIYHLASPVGPVGVLKWAGEMGPMIVADTAKMAKLAMEQGAKLIDISTSEVYGKDPNGIPQKENIEKVVPSNITVRLEYGVSKLLCEVFLTNLVTRFGLRCNIVRPYNIVSYGQQAAAGFVLPRFLQQALSGLPLTVYQPGTQRRTFTDVRDFVEGIILIMRKGSNGRIYNVGNPANLHSIMDLAKMVVEYTGSSSPINIVDPQIEHGPTFAEAWEKIPNIDLVQKDTGWQPTRTLKDIVEFAISKTKENK